MPTRASSLHLLRKRLPPANPAVTPSSVALFRLGETCNHKCPMCSNAGDPAALFPPVGEVLRRAAFLHSQGFRRVVLTGGEPTLHPAFWPVAQRFQAWQVVWDLHTHGRTFADAALADRAVGLGLERAIVSLHGPDAETCSAMSGAPPQAFDEIQRGIEHLLRSGCRVMVNAVVAAPNLDKLADHMVFLAQRFGPPVSAKLAFPSLQGRGGRWHGIDVTFDQVMPKVQQALRAAEAAGLDLHLEGFPNCVVGQPNRVSMGRTGYGETHYLDDASGDLLHGMAHVEASLAVYGPACRDCPALSRCPGVEEAYARRHGLSELKGFRDTPTAADGDLP
jgi:pyruvate-formate lyase-activating enzyme